MDRIVVASQNPVKINATRLGFESMFRRDDFQMTSISVPSGVSDQPMSSSETLDGAINRARSAREAVPQSDYWVGIEGGLEPHESELAAFAWVNILTSTHEGKGKTASFFLPSVLTELVAQGMELGHACDEVFNANGSKLKGGAIGLLTDNALDRTNFYIQGVIMALVPIKNESFYAPASLDESS